MNWPIDLLFYVAIGIVALIVLLGHYRRTFREEAIQPIIRKEEPKVKNIMGAKKIEQKIEEPEEVEEVIPKKEKSIKEMIMELQSKQDEILADKKAKKFKLPWKSKVSTAKAKRGYATIQVIRDNGEIDFLKAPIQDGTVEVDGLARAATVDYRMTYKNKPFYMIPEWSIKPFSPVDNKKTSDEQQVSSIAARKLVLAKLEGERIKAKNKMGGMGGYIILGLIVLAVGYYVLSGGAG